MLTNSHGGVYQFTQELVSRLGHRGYEYTVLFLHRPEHRSCVRLKDYRYILGGHMIRLDFLSRLLKDQVNLIHTNFATLGLIALFKKSLNNIPVIYTVHGISQPWLEPSTLFKIGYLLEDCFLPCVAKNAAAVVVPSNYLRKVLRGKYGVCSHVIPHGVDPATFRPVDKKTARRRFGFKEDDVIILFVGRLHPYKDPMTLIKASATLAETHKSMRLVLKCTGYGEYRDQIETSIRTYRLSENVTFIGTLDVPDMVLLYNSADVLIFPSIREAFGIAMLEAMSCGLPVVASNSGACPEVVGDAGLLFHPRDPDDLEKKTTKVLNDKCLALKLGERGRARAARFHWNDIILKYQSLYEKTINE